MILNKKLQDLQRLVMEHTLRVANQPEQLCEATHKQVIELSVPKSLCFAASNSLAAERSFWISQYRTHLATSLWEPLKFWQSIGHCSGLLTYQLWNGPSTTWGALHRQQSERHSGVSKYFNYNIVEIQYKSETNLSKSHTGWLGYLNHTGTVCTSTQMVTLPSKWQVCASWDVLSLLFPPP